MLFSISWRNVWRSKSRSLVMITAIALGVCAGIFSAAFYKGMADQRIDKAIKTELSHIQLHHPDFRESNETSKYMPDGFAIADKISKMNNVSGVAKRVILFSMISSAETGVGVKIIGIHPNEESTVSNIPDKVVEGDFFAEGRKNSILIGKKLAEKLKVKLGSKVVLTIQDIDNNIVRGAYRVVGIFNTVNNVFDEANVFVLFDELGDLTNIPNGSCHEIAVLAGDLEAVDGLKSEIATSYPNTEVMTWKDISPEMSYLTEAMDLFMYIFIIIILLALLFGIVNTMLMAVLERTKEIGMLMAVGMNKRRIFTLILLETILLSLTGGVLGVVFGYLVSQYFGVHPIDLSVWADVYLDLGYDPFVYTVLEWGLLVNVTVLVLLTGVIAAIYPAFKALQNDPADALRIE